MSTQRTITPELEAVEAAIDNEHLKNRLTKLTFSEAAWYFLAFCEEMQFKRLEIEGINRRQDTACHADEIVNNMKTPLRWLWETCRPGTQIPRKFCDESYKASWDFYDLAHEYGSFESAYIYARAGAVTLRLQGDAIVPDIPFRKDPRYEAYDRLCINEPTEFDGDRAIEFFDNVSQTVTVSDNRFRYQLNPGIVSYGLDALMPLMSHFWLPDSWSLPRYSFGDFRSVLSAIRVIAMIHHFAHVAAARQGCVALGYLDSVLVMRRGELSKRLKRYTGLGIDVVNAVIHDATFGERDIRNPDPAIQPLIPLTADRIAISPTLFLASDIERNLTVLLNRLPEEKKVYSQLSEDREKISRRRIIDRLQPLGLRFWHGNLPGRNDLPDVDLAVINDIERTCLILELKAFIGPAEPREILEKSEEIEKGVSQINVLRNSTRLESALLNGPLEIDGSYDVSFALASETFVGIPSVQDETVPVVRIDHLVRRLLAGNSLSSVCDWLQTRDYLPVEGTHFEVRDVDAHVGDWRLRWYGIRSLINDNYL